MQTSTINSEDELYFINSRFMKFVQKNCTTEILQFLKAALGFN